MGIRPIALGAPSSGSADDYDLAFSTYIGGSGWEHLRDIFVDGDGYVYITGGTASDDYPTTPGAYDRIFDFGGSGLAGAGPCDVVVTKFDPNGTIVWSTYMGGKNYDRGYAVEVDDQGYVYIAGRAGPGFPVTAGALQTTYQGVWGNWYGDQNAFVAKLEPDGSDLVWATYVGTGSLCRDMDIDDDGDVYVPLAYDGSGGDPPASWFQNAYQDTRRGGQETGAVKIKGDGTQVLWATWLGGSGDDSGATSIRVDDNETVHLCSTTFSADIPTTPGAYCRTYKGGGDFYVAKLKSDGSDLIYGTYIGGASDDWINTHNLAIDDQGNAFVSIPAHADFPTTPGAYQTTLAGGNNDIAIAKFSPTGGLLASTFIGGNGNENPDGIYTDADGNLYFSAGTSSTDFPVSGNAYQTSYGGGSGDDAVFVKLSPDLDELLYSTYLGGARGEAGRTGCIGPDGSWLLAGQADGPGWPVRNANQSAFGGGTMDGIVAKFSPPAPADAPPAIEVWEPGGTPGQVHARGDMVTVSWVATDDHALPPDPINMSYGSDTVGWTAVATAEANDGIYLWDTSPVPPGTYWMNLSVRDSGGNTTHGISNHSFEIAVPDGPPTIEVWEPGGTPGQSYVQGDVVNVTWTAVDDYPLPAGPIGISFGGTTSGWTVLSTAEANDGRYLWNTSSVPAGTYWTNLSVRDSTGQTAFDIGNHSFEIVMLPDELPTIEVWEPGGTPGQTYVLGEQVEVTWSSTDDHPLPSNPIEIAFGDGAGSWTTISTATENDGEHIWDTSLGPAPGNYWMRLMVTDSMGQFAYGVSNHSFDILVPPDDPPTVEVYEPGGSFGQTLTQGDIVNVTWYASDDATLPQAAINISYGGPSTGWTLLATGEADDGAYAWDTSTVPPGTYWVKIGVLDTAFQTASDISNHSFEIVLPITHPPVIGDVVIDPINQTVGGMVGVTVTVIEEDTPALNLSVWINVTQPDGEVLGNYTMSYDRIWDQFWYRSTFDEEGVYSFVIWVGDDDGHWVSSSGNFRMDPKTEPEPEPQEDNHKPTVALVFSVVLLILGIPVVIRRPLRVSESIAMNRAMTLVGGVLSFVILELATGAYSSVSGNLSVPPYTSSGMIVDLVILVIGLLAIAIIAKEGGKDQ